MISRDSVRLLDVDPELGDDLEPRARESALRDLVAATETIPIGAWNPLQTLGERRPIGGLLVLDGLVLRDLELARRASTEVLGAGDLLRPWDAPGGGDTLPATVRWQVLDPLRLAIIDERVLLSAARHPSVLGMLMDRGTRRAQRLAIRSAVNQLVRLEDRLMLTLWALAERWGRVTPGGVLVPVALTHSALARLVGARRPSVTTALGVLARDRALERTEEGWLVRGDPAAILAPAEGATRRAPAA
jgi:CRP/FNR family cyclic AMP-dependent transcriptional regulator